MRKGTAMFLSLCDKEFHVCFQIPIGGLVCGTEPRGEHAKAASVSFTQDRGQLPGDKGFLFAFVRGGPDLCAGATK